MEERVYYRQGFCEALSLNGLNPVLYTGEGERDIIYQKVKMVCSAIENGNCNLCEDCKIFLEAPDTMEDDGAQMVKTKYRPV